MAAFNNRKQKDVSVEETEMDVLFITITEKIRLREEVNGSLILATKLLDAGFSADILRFGQFNSWRKDYSQFIREITDRIIEIAPKCICLYTLCSTYHIILRIACEVRKKKPDIKIVLGGPQATILAYETMEAMPFVDYVCMDEGENTIVPFVRALLRCNGDGLEEIPGLLHRKNGNIIKNEQPVLLTDLDTVPYWNDVLLLPEEGKAEPDISSEHYAMSIDAGRGCPYNCTYCSTSYFWHRRYRMKSPQRIVEDMAYYNNKFGIRCFDVAHDAFTVNPQMVSEICDKILEKKLDIKWLCTTRIDCITKELILKMKQAGMYRIAFGIETGSARMQKKIKKNLNLETVKPMVQFLLDNKIKVALFFMYGFPEETLEDLKETLKLAFELLDMGIERVKMHFCLFDPCTEVTVENYDALTFDPSVNRVFKSVFGWNEEIEMFKSNKFLFSFYYSLNTPVRNDYQYLTYLLYLYQGNRDIFKHIRTLYNGDDLALYKDFYTANQHYLKDIDNMDETMKNEQLQMIFNLIDLIAPQKENQLKAWAELTNDLYRAYASEKDMYLEKSYNLHIVEFYKKVPFEKLSNVTSTLFIKKENGQVHVSLKGIGSAN